MVGGLALTVVGGAAGIGLALALKTPEPLALGAAGLALLEDDDEEEGALICKSCADEKLQLTAHWGSSRWLTEPSEGEKEEDWGTTAPSDYVSFKEGKKDAESKTNTEDYLKSQTHCLHIDGKTVKRCRRMVYRKSGYCYMHQRESGSWSP